LNIFALLNVFGDGCSVSWTLSLMSKTGTYCCILWFLIVGAGSSLGPVHRSTGPVKILTCVQKLDTCQDFNGSSAPVHWTQSFPVGAMLFLLQFVQGGSQSLGASLGV
jgi:hypothetical protein